MGNTLTGQIVAETYDALLKVTDNNQITGTKKRLTDGFGTDTPMLVSTTDIQIDGNFLTESVQFNTATAQTADTVGKLVWNDADGTLDLRLKGNNVTLQIGQEQVLRAVNDTGASLLEANYQVVRVNGSQGTHLKVALAQANNDANSAETLGVVTETIGNNQQGFITLSGLVRGINTTGSLQGESWVDGDMLYLSGTTPGQLTKVKPTAPTHTVIVGYVVRAHASVGQIFVKVDNGYELDELHNVLISSPTNGQVLAYESATGLWKNQNIVSGVSSFNTRTGAITLNSTDVTSALGYTPVTNARTLTINGTSYDLSTDRSWTINPSQWTTTGSDIYYNTGNVGIGTSTPTQKLDVNGNAVILGTLQVGDASILGTPSYGLTSTAIIGKSGGGVLDIRNTNTNVVAGDVAGSLQFSVKDDASPGYAVARIDAITQINTGTGASGGGNIRFLTAGGGIAAFPTERMRITNTGNVGIGTASPSKLLSVNGLSYFANDIYQAADKGIFFSGDGSYGAGVYGQNSGLDLVANAGNVERMRITSAGNVGIGTTSPGEKLEVQNGAAGAKIKVSNSGGGYASLECSSNATSVAQLTFTNQLSLIGGNVGIGTTSPNAYSGFNGLTLDSTTNGGVLSIRKNGTTYLNIYSGTDLGNIYTEGGSTSMVFGTGGSERMRITSDGRVGVGTTDPGSFKFGVAGAANLITSLSTQDTNIGINYLAGRTTNGTAVYFDRAGSNIGTIYMNASSVSYNTTSDYRLKEDLKDINGLEKLSKIKVYDFKWKGSEERTDGVIAHELQEVLPYAVTGDKDGERMQGVDYSKLVPVLVKAIQELSEKVKQLESK